MNWDLWFAAHKEIVTGVGVLVGAVLGALAHHYAVKQSLRNEYEQHVKLAQGRTDQAHEELARCKREHEEQGKTVRERHALELERVRAEAREERSETDLAKEQAAERREAEMRSMIDALQTQVKGLRRAREQDDGRYEEVAALRLKLDTMDDGAGTREELEALRVEMNRLAAEPSAIAAPLQQVEDTAGELDLTTRAWEKLVAGLAAVRQGTPEALLEAIEHFRQALEIRPKSADAYRGWGNALGYLGRLADDPDAARKCYEGACEKFRQALAIKPDHHGALTGWAAVCLHLSHLSEGEERERWLAEAERLASEAEAIEPGAGIYNLACAHALQGREDEAFAELRQALEGDHEPWPQVAGDPDWNDLREHPEYKKLEAEFGGVSED